MSIPIMNEKEIVFKHISDMIFFVKRTKEKEYIITFTNEVFKNIVKCRTGRENSNNLYEVFESNTCSLLVEAIDNSKFNRGKTITEISIEYGEEKNTYAASIIPINEEKPEDIFLISCNDITNRKEYEEKIKRVQYEAEESSRLKDSLLLNINHEFRTPLHGILGISEMLSEEINDANQKLMLKRITNSGRRLLNTLVSIIELSRLESLEKKIYSTKVMLSETIISVVEKYKVEAEHKGLVLQCNMPDNNLAAHVDESFLRLVITNIVDNAVKFTKKGSIVVSLCKDISSSGFAVIQVTDTGIGISKKNLDKIFNAFMQESEGVGRSHEGIGIGLTLVSQMTKMMGGEVSVESEKNVGSTFTLKFPAINDDKLQYQGGFVNNRTPVLANGTELPLVLIVEDNEMSSTLTKTFLRGKYFVDIAENAVEALKLISQKNYSILLLDINLGSGMNGVDLLKEIRSHFNYMDTPILAMTGYAFNSDKVNFLNNGFTNYIAKPFSKQQLLALLEDSLNILALLHK